MIIRSKDRASGIPKETADPSELTVEAPIDFRFSSSMEEDRVEST